MLSNSLVMAIETTGILVMLLVACVDSVVTCLTLNNASGFPLREIVN